MMKEFWIECDGMKIHPEVVAHMNKNKISIVFLSKKRPNFEFTDKIFANLKSIDDLKCSKEVPRDYFSEITDIEIGFTQKPFED